MSDDTQPLYLVQRAPDGRRFEVTNRETLELHGTPQYDRAAAQRLADSLNAQAAGSPSHSS